MMYTFLFCILPIAIALIPYIIAGLQGYAAMLSEAAREELHRQRIAAINDRIATNQALLEARLAKESNAVMLQDLKIETEKMKQIQLRQKLGMTSEEFMPENYE